MGVYDSHSYACHAETTQTYTKQQGRLLQYKTAQSTQGFLNTSPVQQAHLDSCSRWAPQETLKGGPVSK